MNLAAKAWRHWRDHGALSTARKIAGRLRRIAAGPAGPQPPANYGIVAADDQRIEDDAAYALGVANAYVAGLPGGAAYLRGRSVIELGPGLHLGTALVLRCWGAATMAVADRFLVRYQPAYHGRLYRRIAELLRQESCAADVSPLERCVAARQHLASGLLLIETPLERLSESVRDGFDITLSNAVFEHLFNPLQAIASLARLSRPGSIGLHQVDFRDHRDFSRPLEYLLLDEFSFHDLLTAHHGEYGNRVRPDEMQAMFAAAAFDSVEFHPNFWPEPAYLADFIPRLRAAQASPYADIDEARLAVIGGRFVVRKAAR